VLAFRGDWPLFDFEKLPAPRLRLDGNFHFFALSLVTFAPPDLWAPFILQGAQALQQ
jgi:hypothetical protein